MTALTDLPVPGIQRRRLTVEEYHAMGEAGILHEDDRLELIDGQLIAMSPIGSDHLTCVNRLNRLLVTRTTPDVIVSVQNPVRLGPRDEPEPDLVLFRFEAEGRTPEPADVLLLIEVADTTLAYDREVKLPRYATAGIPEVWIVNLDERHIEVYRQPEGETYRMHTTATTDDRLSVEALPEVAPMPVEAVLRAPQGE